MKTIRLINLLTLLLVVSLLACKKENLKTSGPLYLRFEIDNDKKEYSSNQGYWGGGTSGTGGLDTYGTLSDFANGDLSFEFNNSNEITLSDLLDLEGKTIAFEEGGAINAVFRMDQEGIDAASYQIDKHPQTSVVKIVEVHEEKGTFSPSKLARITGTFECQIKDISGSKTYEIKNGEFSLVFQEI